MFKYPEKYRRAGETGEPGMFRIARKGRTLTCIASNELGWEHVPVSIPNTNTPTWANMAFVKDLFWGKEDMVIQYHPPESDYINIHPGVLHLWRKAGTNDFVETPPKWMV